MSDRTSSRWPKRRARNPSAACERATRLDKYYTKPEVARQCHTLLAPFLDADTMLIEPSAGAGAFIDTADRDIIGIDVDPDGAGIISRDFLALNARPGQNIAFIGNPPFGHRSKLAKAFVNRCLEIGHTVGLVLIDTADQWTFQRSIDPTARLVLTKRLPSTFDFLDGEASYPSVFQIWTKCGKHRDLRMKSRPPQHHPDFDMTMVRPIDRMPAHWDFAVNRFNDRNRFKMIFDESELVENHRYIFFRASSNAVRKRLMAIDYLAIGQRYVRPCMCKHQIVAAYEMQNK
jgi:hypothetical protein